MTQKCTQVRNLGMAHRVLRELRLLRELAHDNVVTLYGVPPRLVRSGAGPQKKIPVNTEPWDNPGHVDSAGAWVATSSTLERACERRDV